LVDELDTRLLEKAKEVSNGRHFLSTIEEIQLIDSNQYKEDNKIFLENIYNVRMVGIFVGSSIYKFDIRVVGYVNMIDDSIIIYDRTVIDE
jgi:hypothetical protein